MGNLPMADPTANDAVPMLHLYGQKDWHDEAYIVGTPDGLRALLAAVQQALETGEGHALPTVSDGEYYHLFVVQMDEDWQSKSVQGLQLPYTEKWIREGHPGKVHPSSLVKGVPGND